MDTEALAALLEDGPLKEAIRATDTRTRLAVPRAITFTAALYSLGIPPEILGTGRGLASLVQTQGQVGLDRLLDFCPQLVSDLEASLAYVNLDLCSDLLPPALVKDYARDLKLIRQHLPQLQPKGGPPLKPYMAAMQALRPLLVKLLQAGPDRGLEDERDRLHLEELIVEMGRLRGSLG